MSGAAIREAREKAGLSQAALAESVGTTQQTVDRIERGETVFSRYAVRMRQRLGMPEDGSGQGAPARSTGRSHSGPHRPTITLKIEATVPIDVARQILDLIEGASR